MDYKYSYLYIENIAPSPSKRISQSWLKKKRKLEKIISREKTRKKTLK